MLTQPVLVSLSAMLVFTASISLVLSTDPSNPTEAAAWTDVHSQVQQDKEDPTPAEVDTFKPVDNMHHFMEYICEPSYKGLLKSLSSEPADRNAWKVVLNHSLVLAETSSMVAQRAPKEEDKSKQWKEIALAVHQSGTKLYKSVGKYEEAKKHFNVMVQHCNQCHTEFAKGKYQLKLID